jgi:hypothetical protein
MVMIQHNEKKCAFVGLCIKHCQKLFAPQKLDDMTEFRSCLNGFIMGSSQEDTITAAKKMAVHFSTGTKTLENYLLNDVTAEELANVVWKIRYVLQNVA